MRRYLLLLLLILFSFSVRSQSDSGIDSLVKVAAELKQDTSKVIVLESISKKLLRTDPDSSMIFSRQALDLSEKLNFKIGKARSLKLIGWALFNKGNYIGALQMYDKSMEAFKAAKDTVGWSNILANIGNIYFNKGDDAKALELFLESLKLAEAVNDKWRISVALINIGTVYQNKEYTHQKAIEYFLRALPLSQELTDHPENVGAIAANLGELYMEKDATLDSALYYFNISQKAYEGTEDLPYTLNDIGKYYIKKKDFEKAIDYQYRALQLATKLESKNDMAISCTGLANSFEAKGDFKNALKYYLEAEKLAKETNAAYFLKDIYKGLSAVYAGLKNYSKAYEYQDKLIAIKDTLYNIDTDKKLGGLQFNFDLEKKEGAIKLLTKDKELQQKEISRQKLVRNTFVGGFAIVLLFAGIFFRQRNRISIEKKRSDELLLNILPAETAEELKATGTAKAKSYDMVSVMFTDFKNFTQASELLSPEELVSEINFCYSEFDRIISKYNIEKIKTIGDAYMCAGGLPVSNTTHPEDIVRAGIEMVDFIRRNKEDREKKGLPFFELRLGIHTGPVVAGIVGIKKFAYDIWGDTVNTASRMESSGEIGKVNISDSTYNLIKDKFLCVHRGKVKAKNKGEIDMYFVEGEKKDFATAENLS